MNLVLVNRKNITFHRPREMLFSSPSGPEMRYFHRIYINPHTRQRMSRIYFWEALRYELPNAPGIMTKTTGRRNVFVPSVILRMYQVFSLRPHRPRYYIPYKQTWADPCAICSQHMFGVLRYDRWATIPNISLEPISNWLVNFTGLHMAAVHGVSLTDFLMLCAEWSRNHFHSLITKSTSYPELSPYHTIPKLSLQL